jgi:hypothetical protein
MRKITLTLISLLGAITAASAIAAPQQTQEEQAVPAVQVTAPLDSRFVLAPNRMTEVRGSYPMSEGQWLNVAIANRKLYAELNERGQVELVQVGENKFKAIGQDMTLVFYQGRNNDQIMITYIPDLDAAVPRYVTMASNR